MAEKLCPICQRPNDANAERCWYCHSELSPNEQPIPVNGTDWLNGLREESEKSHEPIDEAQPTAESEKPEEVPDWLARIRTREQQEREAQANNQEKSQPESAAVEKKEELPDWLKEIKAGYSGKTSEAEQVNQVQESAPPFAAMDSSDHPAASSDNQDDDTDEWLNRLAAWKPTDQESKPSAEETSKVESESTDSGPTLPPMETAPPSQFDLDSLAALHQSEFRPFELNRGDGWQKLEADELENAQDVESQEEKQLSFDDMTPPKEEPPKSNFDINALRESIAVQQSNPDYFAEKTLPDEGLEEEDLSDEEFMDLDSLPVEKTEPPSPDKSIFIASKPGLLPEENVPSPFVPDDLPDWLATAKLEKPENRVIEPLSEEPGTTEGDGRLEKANLPAWLQAARTTPDKSNTGRVSRDESGEEGLLAGISGTLQTPSFGVDIRKPVGYGSALKVSERQKHSANLFANLVDETLDNEDVDIPKKTKSQQLIWRLLLAVALFTIIFLSKGLLASYVIQPALFPPEVVSVYDQVNALPADKPVLLTGDFEAAVAGELSWSSQSLLEHLMRRNLNLVILSSNPSGSTLMTQLLTNAAKKVDGYDLSTHVINLGYLPGGATGVQLLAGNPRTAMPYTHTLEAAWNSDILQNVNTLSDFGALFVLSDKSESSRNWVEQIQPGLGTTPLIFVVSAQAAPLLQPYYQSGQITGYVAGFYGSLAYEQMMQKTNGALSHLGAFQAAMLLVALVILISGLMTLIRPAIVEHKG